MEGKAGMSKPGHLRHRAATFITAFVETASVLSAILSILGVFGLSTLIAAFFIHFLILLIPAIGVLLMTILLAIIFHSYLEDKRKLEEASDQLQKIGPIAADTIAFPPPPEEDVEILREEIVYEYLADGKTMYQRKHLKIRMLRNGVHFFVNRFRWTGNGACLVKSLTPGFKITNQREEDGGIWNFFDVAFPHPYHRGDEVEFTVEWKMVDERGKTNPHLSTMIDRETKYLFLQVSLPLELAPTHVYFHEYKNFIDTLPSNTKAIRWSPASRNITYEVAEPKKYHKYLIRWYYDQATGEDTSG